MKKRPTTEEQRISIVQRYDKPNASCLNFANPLHILMADFTARELSIITGVSQKTIQRQRKAYNFNGTSHKHFVAFADAYLQQLPKTRVTRLLIELNNQWEE
jgi:hypothetical protein